MLIGGFYRKVLIITRLNSTGNKVKNEGLNSLDGVLGLCSIYINICNIAHSEFYYIVINNSFLLYLTVIVPVFLSQHLLAFLRESRN